ncbi:MAG: ATP-binding protein [Pseudomonadota bacterium]
MPIPNWDPLSPKPAPVANLRLVLALLRIYRESPVSPEEVDICSLARTFWPVVRLKKSLLLACLEGSSPPHGFKRYSPRSGEDSAACVTEWVSSQNTGELPLDPPPDFMLAVIGEAFFRPQSRHMPLLEALERRIVRLLATRRITMDANVELLSKMLKFNALETRFLHLCAAGFTSTLGIGQFQLRPGSSNVSRGFALALGTPDEVSVRGMFQRGSPLIRSGFLRVERWTFNTDMEDMLSLSNLGMHLLNASCPEDIPALVLKTLEPGTNDEISWPHLEERAAMLERALVCALAQKKPGVNILLHGGPGTGKTQSASALVKRAHAQGFSIDEKNEDGDGANRSTRLASFLLTQVFAAPGQSIVVLDEAEDIFQGNYNGSIARMMGKTDDCKAWINQMLETNVHPVIWISNRVDHLDPAYVRRFTYCLEFPTTPRALRLNIARSRLEPVGCTAPLLDAIAADPHVSPALISLAAQFCALAGAQGPAADRAVQLMVGDTLKTLGHTRQATVPERSTRFDLRYINCKGSITSEAVLAGLSHRKRGRLLLSGPPGTGKTQLAAEIAKCLGRELVYKTAADINSKWFGESERNVAQMFEGCEADSEVLFLDEADTLLSSRDGPSNRAELAVTSEFLRRLEAFDGVFVCATNFRQHIDAALLRRFEYRLEFLPLSMAQRQFLFCEHALGLQPSQALHQSLDAALSSRLERLDLLTPGDFANVVRRAESLQLNLDATGWLDELEAEQESKPEGGKYMMGFV